MNYFIKNKYQVCLQHILKCIVALVLLNTFLFAEQSVETTVIKSNIINKKDDNIIRAIGNVEIKRGSNILNANEVEYNQSTKTIISNSNVKLYNEDNENIFFSEKALINDDLSNADFYNGIMLFKNGSSISSPHMNRFNEEIITMNKANYNVCPTDLYDKDITYEKIMQKLADQKTPLFSMKSYKATANTENKTIKLVGTSFWVWKIPLFFIPYFDTPYSVEKKVNGFSMPNLEKTSHYGYGINIPYKITTERQKIKITPKIYTKGNYLANVEYSIFQNPIYNNDKKNKWFFNFHSDITNDNGQSKKLTNAYGITEEEEEGDYKKWRGYISSNGFYNINNLWKFNYDVKVISDRYYLRDYYNDNSEYIQSFLNFTRTNLANLYDFNYFQFINLFYQDLLEPIDVNNPRYAPISNLNIQNYIYKKNNSKLLYRIQTNTTNLFRRKGIEYNRFSIMPSFIYMINSKFGIINADLKFRGDIYLLNAVNIDQKIYKNEESRIFPQFNIEWKKSFIFENFLIQPIIKYSGSPNSHNFENKIPNEDSKTNALSFENIFSDNRFFGYDRQEFGNRITCGFESILFDNLNFGIAQGYRDNSKDNNLDGNNLIGFIDHVSDYVGYASYIFNNKINIYYRFLINKDNFKIKREELTTNLNFKYLNLYLSYTNLKPSLFNIEKQKQINSGILITLFDKWKLNFSGIIDLKNNNRLLESEIGLLYDGGCTKWEIVYNNSNPLTETERNTSINFNFIIKFL